MVLPFRFKPGSNTAGILHRSVPTQYQSDCSDSELPMGLSSAACWYSPENVSPTIVRSIKMAMLNTKNKPGSGEMESL